MNTIAYTIMIYALIIALGMLLGRVKVKGVSLGVTFVLFVGIAIGHFQFDIDPNIVDFLKNFGLILFIFMVGLQVGPSFFASFKKGGLQLNGLAVCIALLGIGTTIGLYYLLKGRVSLPMLVGIMSGAITSTPGLGAAEEAMSQIGMNEPISLGYAVAYPLAILGTILVMVLLKLLFRIDTNKENQTLLSAKTSSDERPDILTLKVSNPQIDGMTLSKVKEQFGHNFIATRHFDGKSVSIPHADTPLHMGDLILIVTRDKNAELLESIIGQPVQYDWQDDDYIMVSRRLVVTRSKINGKSIRQLRLRSAFNVNITRVNRSGIDLLATPDLVLQVGDRVMVVGPLKAIEKVENFMGNTLNRLNEPPLITIFIGIFFGILLGSIPIIIPNMPTPARLGLAGGPLIVAILIGRFGYKLKLITYTTQSANLMLREFGLCMFLASVGLASGPQFLEVVLSQDGLIWLLCGAIITIFPPLIVCSLARIIYKTNYFTLCGLVAGAHTNAPPMAYANSLGETDEPAVVYSTIYPLITFIRILAAQILILAFA